MADAEIVVGIRGQTEGGKVVKRTLDDIGESGRKAQQGTKNLENQMKSLDSVSNTLSRTMKGLVAAFGLNELRQTVDAYTNIQNRLKLVTDNSSQLLGVTRELFTISNETRNAFEATAEVYTRTALATKDMGLSQKETLEFTKSLNQAVILSGASAAEAQAGLIQLSQGLASGALRGDELRSVLEQLPMVADVISKSLGVTRGELRQMGQDGKITAQVIIDAFTKARGELDQKFGNTVSTIGQAFTVLKNNITQYIGELDRSTGASSKVADLLLTIGQNIDGITKALVIGAAAWGAYRLAILSVGFAAVISSAAGTITAFVQLAATVTTLSGAVGLLSAACLSLPFVAIAAAAAALAAGFIYLSKSTDTATAAYNRNVELMQKMEKASGSLRIELEKQRQAELNLAIARVDSAKTPEEKANAKAILNNVLLANPAVSFEKPQTVNSVTYQKAPVDQKALEAAQSAAKKNAAELKQIINETSTEQEKLLARIKELERLRGFAKTKEEVAAVDRAIAMANEKLKTASTELPGVTNEMDRLIRQTDKFADSAADAFGDFITGTKSAREALSDFLKDMAKLFLQEGVTSPLSDALRGAIRGSGGSSGGGLFGSLFSGIGSIFTGGSSGGGGLFSGIGKLFGFASGGSMVLGGNAGIDQNLLSLNGAPIANVGRGEVLSISPNQKGGGAGVVVNQTINVSTGVKETVRAEMVAMLPEFQNRTVAAVNEANLRGY